MAVKIELLTSPTCPNCPAAKKALSEYSRERGIPLKEFSTAKGFGKKWADKFGVTSVPSFVVYGEKRPILKTGAPTRSELEHMVALADGKAEVKKGFFQRLFG